MVSGQAELSPEPKGANGQGLSGPPPVYPEQVLEGGIETCVPQACAAVSPDGEATASLRIEDPVAGSGQNASAEIRVDATPSTGEEPLEVHLRAAGNSVDAAPVRDVEEKLYQYGIEVRTTPPGSIMSNRAGRVDVPRVVAQGARAIEEASGSEAAARAAGDGGVPTQGETSFAGPEMEAWSPASDEPVDSLPDEPAVAMASQPVARLGEESLALWGTWLVGAVVVAATCVVWWLWHARFLAFSGFFTRLRCDDVENGAGRGRILAFLQQSSWATIAGISAGAAIPRSTVRYHVRVLARHGLVVSHSDRGRSTYAARGTPKPTPGSTSTATATALGPDTPLLRLEDALRRLMVRRGVSRATAWRAIRGAARHGAVQLERQGPRVWVRTGPSPATR